MFHICQRHRVMLLVCVNAFLVRSLPSMLGITIANLDQIRSALSNDTVTSEQNGTIVNSSSVPCQQATKFASSDRTAVLFGGEAIPAQALCMSSFETGLALGANFLGNIACQILFSFLYELVPANRLLCLAGFLAALINLAAVLGLHTSYYVLLASRIALGLAMCLVPTGRQKMAARWVKGFEKGRIMGTLAAMLQVAPAASVALYGSITYYMGWMIPHFLFFAISSVWALLWIIYVPLTAPLQKPAEIQAVIDKPSKNTHLLEQSQSDQIRNLKTEEPSQATRSPLCFKLSSVPFRSILTSPPVYGLALVHSIRMWCYAFTELNLVTYLREVHGVPVVRGALLAALPMASSVLGLLSWAWFCDFVNRRHLCGTTTLRKIVVFFGCLGLILYHSAAVYLSSLLSVCAFICVGEVLGAGLMLIIQVNFTDLTPNYCNIVVGISGSLSFVSSFINPIVIKSLTAGGNADGWNRYFVLSSGYTAIAGIGFLIIGSGEKQAWNDQQKRSPISGRMPQELGDEPQPDTGMVSTLGSTLSLAI